MKPGFLFFLLTLLFACPKSQAQLAKSKNHTYNVTITMEWEPKIKCNIYAIKDSSILVNNIIHSELDGWVIYTDTTTIREIFISDVERIVIKKRKFNVAGSIIGGLLGATAGAAIGSGAKDDLVATTQEKTFIYSVTLGITGFAIGSQINLGRKKFVIKKSIISYDNQKDEIEKYASLK